MQRHDTENASKCKPVCTLTQVCKKHLLAEGLGHDIGHDGSFLGSRTRLVMTIGPRLAQKRVRIGQNDTDLYCRRKRCLMPHEKRFVR